MDYILQSFNGDVNTKEAVIAFIHEYISTEAVRRIYAGESVSGVKDAKELIDGAFESLKEKYAIPTKPVETSTTAR